MDNKNLKDVTERYIDLIQKQTEDKAGLAITEVLIKSTVLVDKLSNSLLIISGAALTICIGNSSNVISVLGSGSYKLLLLLFLLSAIFGLIAKFLHYYSVMAISTGKELLSSIDIIHNEFEKFQESEIEKVKEFVEIESKPLNLERIFDSFINSMPVVIRNKLRKSINSRNNQDGDIAVFHRGASTASIYQLLGFLIQVLFIGIAILVAILGVE